MLRALSVGALTVVAMSALAAPAQDPGPGAGDDTGFDQRFPQRPPPAPDAGAPSVIPSRDKVAATPGACDLVDPAARLSCPLPGRVTRVEDIPGGLRLTVRERGLPASKLQAVLACQAALVSVRPDVPPACSFLAPPPEVRARKTGKPGMATIDLLWPGADEGTLGIRRTRTRTALEAR
jgi:hypothetical protein